VYRKQREVEGLEIVQLMAELVFERTVSHRVQFTSTHPVASLDRVFSHKSPLLTLIIFLTTCDKRSPPWHGLRIVSVFLSWKRSVLCPL
jgi:hypothetical protein